MPGVCCVQGCPVVSKKSSHMFSFPRDEEKRNVWIECIPRKNKSSWVITTNTKICSRHFEERHIKKTTVQIQEDGLEVNLTRKNWTLLPGAIPTIFPVQQEEAEELEPEKDIPISKNCSSDTSNRSNNNNNNTNNSSDSEDNSDKIVAISKMSGIDDYPDDNEELIPALTLQLDCYPDELSPAQLAAYEKAEKEHNEIRNKLSDAVKDSENIFAGEIFKAYQISGAATSGLEKITKSVADLKKMAASSIDSPSPNAATTQLAKIRVATDKNAPSRNDGNKKRTFQETETDDYDEEDYMPLSKRTVKHKEKDKKDKEKNDKTNTSSSAAPSSSTTTPASKDKDKSTKKRNTALSEAPTKIQQTSSVKPSENTAVGGLSVGSGDSKKGSTSSTAPSVSVVDLTTDENGTSKVAADSREISFNKLQGKTFPSLVVVARPCLKVKDFAPSDRGALDSRVKNVLMHTATKFTEWLIQQGLVRSEQICLNHLNVNLKLGMYSDATKFPYSGGYVWISDCCQARFVSVFNGSLFEGSTHPPSVLLKLIYHWACQTNVQNVVQWVKVDNLFVKGLYTWLRAVCTVALHQHMTLLGGAGKKIEVGVISLGTTTQDGQQRQVKVEVLGVLDPEAKLVRLRAVEPLNEGERNYKKRFSKILEPLSSWVHKDSIILTDLTVDKGTLNTMGYKTVHQTSSSSDAQNRNTNGHIMDYLRRIVPRMFQNTLSLLSRQIIQQFLDELVWREWYGVSPGQAFDNVVSHIAEQTRLDNKDTLVTRLNRVAANPFKNWSHLGVKASASSSNSKDLPTTSALVGSPNSSSSSSKKNRSASKRLSSSAAAPKESSPSPTPLPSSKKKKSATTHHHDDPSTTNDDVKKTTTTSLKKVDRKSTSTVKKEPEEDVISLEAFFYGILEDDNHVPEPCDDFHVVCSECDAEFDRNIDLLDHLREHANPTKDDTNRQCRYCLENWMNDEALQKHMTLSHPIETKNSVSPTFNCIICESRYSTIPMLGAHMQKFHLPSEMPYKCCACNFMSSSQRITVDHFYAQHSNTNMLQCPFCLKSNTIFLDGKTIVENVKSFVIHLRQHFNSSQSKKCNRCCSRFMHKGALKTHQIYSHVSSSHLESKIKPLCATSAKIFKPKLAAKNFNQKDVLTYKIIEKYPNVTINCDDGLFCLECGTNFDDDRHFIGLIKCYKCEYKTCCLPSMLDHTSGCQGAQLDSTITCKLNMEMHCLCGFSSSEGNALARHLATCDRRSAYPSVEAAQENTVKRNMLDMLGLVRRADDDNEGAGTEQNDVAASVTTATEAQQSFDDVGGGGGGGDVQQFNTQLSLDDLGPPSVLTTTQSSEPDRTPQLKEYQSLATPRVPHLEQQGNDY